MKIPDELRSRLEDEVGDLLFVLVNIARYLALDPESALRKTNRKFRRRFRVSRRPACASRGVSRPMPRWRKWKSLWQESKRQEKA